MTGAKALSPGCVFAKTLAVCEKEADMRRGRGQETAMLAFTRIS